MLNTKSLVNSYKGKNDQKNELKTRENIDILKYI